jgi:hypothetical protein
MSRDVLVMGDEVLVGDEFNHFNFDFRKLIRFKIAIVQRLVQRLYDDAYYPVTSGELQYLYDCLCNGRVSGRQYWRSDYNCGCLIGTLEYKRYGWVEGMSSPSSSCCRFPFGRSVMSIEERMFLRVDMGAKPDNSQYCKFIAGVIQDVIDIVKIRETMTRVNISSSEVELPL